MKKIIWSVISILTLILVSAESTFLSDYMEEGQTKVYEMGDGLYVLNLLSVSDSSKKAVFRLNDEMSKGIKLKDSYIFEDGSEIVLRELALNDAEGVSDEAYYYFYGTGKDTLKLKNVSQYVLDNNLCNFDTQCKDETKENCCYDCGCNDLEECINNKCISTEEEERTTPPITGQVVAEEEKEETKKDLEIKKGSSEKKVAKTILWVSLAIILLATWRVLKKRKRRNIF